MKRNRQAIIISSNVKLDKIRTKTGFDEQEILR